MHNQLFEALELLIDNISTEEWERLPPYVAKAALKAFDEAKAGEVCHA